MMDGTPVQGLQGMQLTLTEADLEPLAKGALKGAGKTRVLGAADAQQALFDAIPAAIAKKLQRILPKDFEIREIEMKITLNGTICGVGLNGDVNVKFAPSKTASG